MLHELTGRTNTIAVPEKEPTRLTNWPKSGTKTAIIAVITTNDALMIFVKKKQLRKTLRGSKNILWVIFENN